MGTLRYPMTSQIITFDLLHQYFNKNLLRHSCQAHPWVQIHYWCTALIWKIVKMTIADWLPYPPPLNINIGFAKRDANRWMTAIRYDTQLAKKSSEFNLAITNHGHSPGLRHSVWQSHPTFSTTSYGMKTSNESLLVFFP